MGGNTYPQFPTRDIGQPGRFVWGCGLTILGDTDFTIPANAVAAIPHPNAIRQGGAGLCTVTVVRPAGSTLGLQGVALDQLPGQVQNPTNWMLTMDFT